MREFAIVGRPNADKTLFALNFAAFLGNRVVEVVARSHDGLITCRRLGIEEARRELCSPEAHRTRSLQSMTLKAPLGKITGEFKLTDSCGLSSSIHPDDAVRLGMAQTLGLIRSAGFVLHVIDLTFRDLADPTDAEVYGYGALKSGYVILANKLDIGIARTALPRLAALYPKARIIGVSALTGDGFREVKQHVVRNL